MQIPHLPTLRLCPNSKFIIGAMIAFVPLHKVCHVMCRYKMVLVVFRILNMHVLFFCVVYDQSDFMFLFMVFNLWIGEGFIF